MKCMKLGKRTILKKPQAKLEYSSDDLRWATPQAVADYRAQRLKCSVIADIGCGIGFQAIAFAKTCRKVYALDLNQEKLEKAKKNAQISGIKNIEFVYGDALNPEVIKKLKNADIIFCDPQRPPQENSRTIETLSPNILELLKAYGKITSKIAIEFPPQIKEIPFDCEREYLSVNGSLNRLTLYFNELKGTDRSAVALPGNHRLASSNKKIALKTSKKLLACLYEIDPAAVKAKLLAELSQLSKTALYDENKNVFFTSDKLARNNFFKNAFKVLKEVSFEASSLVKALQQAQAKSIVLRYAIDPREYWSERKKWESGLTGTKTIHLFKFKNKAVIAEKI